MELVLTAIVTGIFGLGVEILRRTQRLGKKIQTNDGKEPFEYLEMIGLVAKKQDRLLDALAEHTVQDDLNFREILTRVDRLEGFAPHARPIGFDRGYRWLPPSVPLGHEEE